MPQHTITTKFWHFRQNNSGGLFDIDDSRGIGVDVWIEAASLEDAERRAEQIGLYFNGVQDGRDCDCCGDRWYAPWGDAGVEAPIINFDDQHQFSCHNTVYVHHMDGVIERVMKTEPDASAPSF
jgi:hypothetical protein